jgi:hypothetical protein
MPSRLINNAEHWRERTEEMRTIADCARDRDAKDTMLKVGASSLNAPKTL